jgi:CelD/BcsL family acetyltransferase involved in cellulose biosynthesis
LALAGAGLPEAERGLVAVIRGPKREPVGFFPARVQRFTALPAGAPLCDYQALVCAPEHRPDPRALVKAFGVGRIDVQNCLADDEAFAPFLRAKQESLIVDLSAGYDAYAAHRCAAGTDILKDCAKKRRKLEREHGAVTYTADSRSEADFDQLIAWKRAQYRTTEQTDLFAAGWPLLLLKSLWRDATRDFGARLHTLHAGDRLIAAHLALAAPGVLHAWFIGHDDAFGKYSPGVVLIADMLKRAPQDGVRELDLGPGDYRFKTSLANARRPVGHGFVGRPSPAALVRSAEYGVRDMVERLPLGAACDLPGKAMRRLDILRGLRGG